MLKILNIYGQILSLEQLLGLEVVIQKFKIHKIEVLDSTSIGIYKT